MLCNNTHSILRNHFLSGGAGGGWQFVDPASWVDTGKTYDLSALDFLRDIAYWNNNIYILRTNTIRQYSLPADGDISGLSYVGQFSTGYSICYGLTISSCGTYAFYGTQQDPPYLVRATMSTPGTISTASVTQTKLYSYWSTRPLGIDFSPTGDKALLTTTNPGSGAETYREYDLSTNFDLTTMTQVDTAVATNTYGLKFVGNGIQFLDWNAGGKLLYFHELETAYELLNESTSSDSFATITRPQGIAYWTNGIYAYFLDTTDELIYQYATDSQEVEKGDYWLVSDGTAHLNLNLPLVGTDDYQYVMAAHTATNPPSMYMFGMWHPTNPWTYRHIPYYFSSAGKVQRQVGSQLLEENYSWGVGEEYEVKKQSNDISIEGPAGFKGWNGAGFFPSTTYNKMLLFALNTYNGGDPDAISPQIYTTSRCGEFIWWNGGWAAGNKRFDLWPVPSGMKAKGASTFAPSNCMWDDVSKTYIENAAGAGAFSIMDRRL